MEQIYLIVEEWLDHSEIRWDFGNYDWHAAEQVTHLLNHKAMTEAGFTGDIYEWQLNEGTSYYSTRLVQAGVKLVTDHPFTPRKHNEDYQWCVFMVPSGPQEPPPGGGFYGWAEGCGLKEQFHIPLNDPVSSIPRQVTHSPIVRN